PLPPVAVDLIVRASSEQITVDDASPISYSITASNRSATTATDVALSSTVPSGLTLRSITSNLGSCTLIGSNLVCHVGSLPANGTFTVDIILDHLTIPEESQDEALIWDIDWDIISADTEANPADNKVNVNVVVVVPRDFGDAPEPIYPTLQIS